MKPVFFVAMLIGLLPASEPLLSQVSPPAKEMVPPPLVDPMRLAAAREMLTASRVIRNARLGAVLGFEAGFNASIEKSGIADDQELVTAIRKAGLGELDQAFSVVIPQMIEDLALSYSQKMTTDEMKSVTAFYLSAPGEKLLDLMPVMMTEANTKMQERLAPFMPKVEEAAKQAVQAVLARRAKKGSPL